jgi:hypothetical protein
MALYKYDERLRQSDSPAFDKGHARQPPHCGPGIYQVISADKKSLWRRITAFYLRTITNTNPKHRYSGGSSLVREKSEAKMTHDRIVDLTTKLHHTSHLSTEETQEIAKMLGQQNHSLKLLLSAL